MYIKLKQDLKIINFDGDIRRQLEQKVVAVESRIDSQSGIVEKFYKIKIFCQINKENFVVSGCSDILPLISEKPLDEYERKASESLTEQLVSGNGSPKGQMMELRSSVLFGADAKKEALHGLYTDLEKFGAFKPKTEKSLQIRGKKVIVEDKSAKAVNDLREIEKQYIEDLSKYSQNTFSKNYKNLVKNGIDPLSVFENSFQKKSSIINRGGLIPPSSPLKHSNFKLYLKQPYEQITSEIRRISNKQKVFRKDKVPELNLNLSSETTINAKKLQQLPSTFYIFLIARNRNGVYLQVESLLVERDAILNQENVSVIEYSAGAARKKIGGASKLILGNNSKLGSCNLSVYAKTIAAIDNFENIDFEKIADLTIPPRSKVRIEDDTITSTSTEATPVRFTIGKNVMYRSNFTYANLQFDNTKSTFCKAFSKKIFVKPFCVLTSKVHSGYIELSALRLDSDIKAVRLCKYELYSGKRKHKKLTMSKQGTLNNKFISVKNTDEITILDYDVFDNETYEYVLECITSNGEKKLTTGSCIEQYYERQDIVSFEQTEVQKLGKSVKILFSISIKRDDITDFIVRNFGKDVVQNDPTISQLASIAEFDVSVVVEKINKTTGETSIVDVVRASSIVTEKFEVKDLLTDATHKICYRLLPRVKSTQMISQEIFGLLSSANTQLANPYTPAYASATNSIGNINRSTERRINSLVRQKYSRTNSLKRGIIETEDIIADKQASDIFYDSYTGDVAYVNLPNESDVSEFNLDIKFRQCYEIKTLNDTNREYKTLFEKKIALEFDISNDHKIDFYAIFVKDGNQVYLDGAVHSKGSSKQINMNVFTNSYRYLATHNGNAGEVSYFIVPITKTGKIIGPRLLVRKVI